ncbi:hypothetical protein M406DRAFT_48282 [Cryphonectria parasitica EP155]|uniref:F-box domain-containing protein n=1 Tax=Cryphonectria parasitica (strain ATCC 38755 / EP155) TaxID=660469 RepID=A0A9P5CKG9_CRYP1|nr:uncharacterized protein M406DRAFT_48282 [Cryphonectria parasitica EP155]KAF3760760.1 hypothetical protein M406DRAFT_48282 [Cryphonectria parasitica EP155]
MAVFVDLDDDDVDLPQQGLNGMKPVWNGTLPSETSTRSPLKDDGHSLQGPDPSDSIHREEGAHERAVREIYPNSMTVALGCYPIVIAIASQLDLNDLDSLSHVCRGIHNSLLQNWSILVKSSLHCSNDDLPVDPDSTLRYRARAGNWFYMEDTTRSAQYNGKAGSCARDLVSDCRRCGTVVCRNCAIKPPAPAVLRDRHRRLCLPCQKAPIDRLMKPAVQGRGMSLTSHTMQQAVCMIWKWRTQYGEVLGGLGTGIGDADRGVECARAKDCISGKFIEHETDCDADDAREAEDLAAGYSSGGTPPVSLYSGSHSWSSSHSSLHSSSPTPGSLLDPSLALGTTTSRTPSPAVGPGYARHEVEGIGNKIKTVKVSMVRVGGGVPEWKDEKASGQTLRREVSGEVRSWCGWCNRVIPGRKDFEAEKARRDLITATDAS